MTNKDNGDTSLGSNVWRRNRKTVTWPKVIILLVKLHYHLYSEEFHSYNKKQNENDIINTEIYEINCDIKSLSK